MVNGTPFLVRVLGSLDLYTGRASMPRSRCATGSKPSSRISSKQLRSMPDNATEACSEYGRSPLMPMRLPHSPAKSSIPLPSGSTMASIAVRPQWSRATRSPSPATLLATNSANDPAAPNWAWPSITSAPLEGANPGWISKSMQSSSKYPWASATMASMIPAAAAKSNPVTKVILPASRLAWHRSAAASGSGSGAASGSAAGSGSGSAAGSGSGAASGSAAGSGSGSGAGSGSGSTAGSGSAAGAGSGVAASSSSPPHAAANQRHHEQRQQHAL